jgi:hypothetical protein
VHTLLWAPALTWPMGLGFLKLSHRLRLPTRVDPKAAQPTPTPTPHHPGSSRASAKQQQQQQQEQPTDLNAAAKHLPLPPPVQANPSAVATWLEGARQVRESVTYDTGVKGAG